MLSFYDVSKCFQMDLSYMPEYNGYKYFLVVIDVFSKHIYTRPLKEKTSNAVGKAFEDIYQEFESPIFKLESDNVLLFNSLQITKLLNK